MLEAGHEGGPFWAWIIMLVGAGLTALYTLRFLAMVFYGEPRGTKHVHDAGPAMKVALVPLAFGTLDDLAAGWGRSGTSSGRRFPAGHEVEATGALLVQIATAPATFVALAVVACGPRRLVAARAAVWRGRRARRHRNDGEKPASASKQSTAVWVRTTVASAEALRTLHNGILNWNIVAILVGLVVVLAILAFGGAQAL